MTLSRTLEKDYVAAYKARQAVRVSVLRLLKTAAKNRLVELRRPGGELDDAEMTDVVLREAKQRRESAAEYGKAGRADLAERELAELAVLEEYLPKPLSEEELAAAVEAKIAETGAKGPADMGRVMGPLMKELKGRADGSRLSALVKAALAARGAA